MRASAGKLLVTAPFFLTATWLLLAAAGDFSLSSVGEIPRTAGLVGKSTPGIDAAFVVLFRWIGMQLLVVALTIFVLTVGVYRGRSRGFPAPLVILSIGVLSAQLLTLSSLKVPAMILVPALVLLVFVVVAAVLLSRVEKVDQGA